jgi:dTDP-4-amino-4,6-dideoxygalactose transaminase
MRIDDTPFLDLRAAHHDLEEDLLDVVRRAIRSGVFVGGPEVTAFEQEFAAFVGTGGCVGVSSGTDALRLCFLTLGLRPGDEVVTVPHTFIATTEAITQAGGVVRFVDIDERTMTMDPAQLAGAVSPRTVGIVPVHLYGQPADMDPIVALARQRGLWVVEDACQAHGARYKGRAAGSMGELAAFSFYPGKNLGALGDAGAITGPSDENLERVRQLREHGQSSKYVHQREGYTARLDAIQAGFLRIKLARLAHWTERRREVAEHYRKALAGISEIVLPEEAEYAFHVYHLYVIRAQRRDDLQRHLRDRKVGTGLHYPCPLHLQQAYEHRAERRGSYPCAERVADALLSLPMYPEMTEAHVAHVADAVRRFYGA